MPSFFTGCPLFLALEMAVRNSSPRLSRAILKRLVTAQGIGQKEQRKARTDEEQREESGERKPSPSDSLKGNSPLMPLEDRGQRGKDGKVLLAERLGEGKQLGKSDCAL